MTQIGGYELGPVLGRGSFGEVRRARRLSDDRQFALKILLDPDASAVRDLKHEARTLWNLPTVGLATPSDLGVDEDRWYVALPLIEGRDIVAAAKDIPTGARSEWLADKLTQLTSTLGALHEAGLLHLDIKPANVMVSDTGVVTLLDFGFSRWISRTPPGALGLTTDTGGTLGYMAPELLGGQAPTVASDWYSIGAVVHELLVGRPPMMGWGRPAPVLGDSKLEVLCAGLLAPTPEQRSGIDEVWDALGLKGRARGPSASESPLFGRDEDLKHVLEALGHGQTDEPCAVFIEGPAGVGKTRLMQAVEAATAGGGATLMSGRCYEHERTPYKGLEGITSLLRERNLSSDPAAGFLLPGVGAEFVGVDDRPQAYRNFASLLAAAFEGTAGVLLIDDIHWLDEDGAALLGALLGAPERPIRALIAASRSSDSRQQLRRQLDDQGAAGVRVVGHPLRGLDPDAARRVVRGRAPELSDDEQEMILQAADGSPFALEQLAAQRRLGAPEGAAATISGALDARMDQLGAAERAAMELVALSAGPIAEQAVLAACNEIATSEPNFAWLRSTAWLRSVSGEHERVAIYHDVLRRCLVDSLSAPRRTTYTSALYDALLATNAGPHELFPHALSLGHRQRAAQWAVAAGEAAERAYAFEAAARWYEQAHEHAESTWATQQRLAQRAAVGWYAAGRPAAAAPLFLQQANEVEDDEQGDLVLLAADALMVGGHVLEGRRLLSPWLRRRRVPGARGRWRVLGSIIWRLLSSRLPSLDGLEHSPHSSPRAAMAWTLGKGLAYTDPLESLDYALLALRVAIHDQDPRHTAILLAFIGGGVFHHIAPLRGRGEQYVAAARRLATELQDEALLAHTRLWRGIQLLDQGEWDQAMDVLDQTLIGLVGRRDAHWERTTAQQSRLWITWKRGEFGTLRQQSSALLSDATQRGDALGRAVFVQYVAFSSLAAGLGPTARQATAWLRTSWSAGRFTTQGFYAAMIEVVAGCLAGDHDEAWRAWRSVQRDFRLSGGNRAPVVALENLEAEARLRIHAGVALNRRELGKIIQRLEALERPNGIALARWVDAALSGTDDALREAAQGLRAVGQESVALALELQLNPEGESATRLRERGVSAPERWSRALYPSGRTPM